MQSNWLRFVCVSLLVILLQVWVLSPMTLFRVATPHIYPVLLLLLPIGMRQISLTVVGFVVGSILDLLSLTPGLHASALTAVAFARYYMVQRMIPKDTLQTLAAVPQTIGGRAYLLLLYILLLHHLLLYGLDALGTFDSLHLLGRMSAGLALSYLVSLLLLLALGIRYSPEK